MPNQPGISAPEFGKWLKEKRGNRSLERIAITLREWLTEAGVPMKVSRGTLNRYEDGRVPAWPMAAALSHAYGVSIEETALRLARALQFPKSDHIRHGSKAASDPRSATGGSDATLAATQTRIQQLEDQLRDQTARHKAALNAMQDVVDLLTGTLARDPDAASPDNAGTGNPESLPRKRAPRHRSQDHS